MILHINILTTATLWDKYRECKLPSQLQKFLNICYLNITSENKYHRNTYAIGINNINITYQMDYDRLSYISQYLWGMCADYITWSRRFKHTGLQSLPIQVTTGVRLSGTCTRKWYILIYLAVPIMYICRCYYISTHWYIYMMIMKSWYYYHMSQLFIPQSS